MEDETLKCLYEMFSCEYENLGSSTELNKMEQHIDNLKEILQNIKKKNT